MWSCERAWEWYNHQPWIVGFNYLPSNAVNSTAMWQKEVFDEVLVERELRAAADIGYNACRVFLQYILWEDNAAEMMDIFDRFLSIAETCGIRAMPIFFDDCCFAGKQPYPGPQDEPTPGIHNSCWTPSPGFARADDPDMQENLRAYLHAFLKKYASDKRILAWDLYNEPGNTGRQEKSLPLVRSAFAWARECSPAQPLTTGCWSYEAWAEAMNREIISLADVVSYHDYGPIEETASLVGAFKACGRPMLCTEWLHRPRNCRFETHMPYYREQNIGIFNWGLVAGKTQTYLDWNPAVNPKEGMPELWQHDILYPDLTPYCEEEIALIDSLTRNITR